MKEPLYSSWEKADGWGMTKREYWDMCEWVTANASDPVVLRWLAETELPEGWQGTRLEYAYLEMPLPG